MCKKCVILRLVIRTILIISLHFFKDHLRQVVFCFTIEVRVGP